MMLIQLCYPPVAIMFLEFGGFYPPFYPLFLWQSAKKDRAETLSCQYFIPQG